MKKRHVEMLLAMVVTATGSLALGACIAWLALN
jgi:hypothetical protein